MLINNYIGKKEGKKKGKREEGESSMDRIASSAYPTTTIQQQQQQQQGQQQQQRQQEEEEEKKFQIREIEEIVDRAREAQIIDEKQALLLKMSIFHLREGEKKEEEEEEEEEREDEEEYPSGNDSTM